MIAVLICQMAAFWPVWRWYGARLTDGSDEPWGAAALLAAAALCVCRDARTKEPSAAQRRIIAATLLLYAASYPFAPPLVRALIAVVSLAASGSALRGRETLDTALLGVAVLSLPIIASLQFYLGYPLRVCSAQIAAEIIKTLGYSVAVKGSAFEWRGDPIVVDAPCSGVKMLWSGLFATFALAAAARLGARDTWRAYACASLMIFAANVLRITALFFTETHLVQAPRQFHSGIGLALFAAVMAASAANVKRLSYANARAA
jgi:exosortase/archaeosortase family protein